MSTYFVTLNVFPFHHLKNKYRSWILQTIMAMHNLSFIHSHFYVKTSMRCFLVFYYFSRFIKNFPCYFFQKQASKDYLAKETVKNNVIEWKTNQSWKWNVWKYSLYPQYFSPGAENNVHKTYFYFLKLTKSVLFYLARSKKLNIK